LESTVSHPRQVELSPMSFISGASIIRFVGRVNVHFIKESFTIREQGGLGGFTHLFLNEANAIVRAHVASLGGNALISYRIDDCNIMENISKNQSYSLISISGDAVSIVEKDPSLSSLSTEWLQHSMDD